LLSQKLTSIEEPSIPLASMMARSRTPQQHYEGGMSFTELRR
jgi:hypothetical protein